MENNLLLLKDGIRKHVTWDVENGYTVWDETGAYPVGTTHYVELVEVMFEEYCKRYLGDTYDAV